jgi:hypothetical protein
MIKLDSESDQKKLSSSIESYRAKLSDYNGVQLEEVKRMRKILGDKRFAKYLVLKRDLNQKIKNMLSSTSRPEANSPKE